MSSFLYSEMNWQKYIMILGVTYLVPRHLHDFYGSNIILCQSSLPNLLRIFQNLSQAV
jgi:hypothetical protein